MKILTNVVNFLKPRKKNCNTCTKLYAIVDHKTGTWNVNVVLFIIGEFFIINIDQSKIGVTARMRNRTYLAIYIFVMYPTFYRGRYLFFYLIFKILHTKIYYIFFFFFLKKMFRRLHLATFDLLYF